MTGLQVWAHWGVQAWLLTQAILLAVDLANEVAMVRYARRQP